MKDKIITHLNEPAELEKMYRTNKITFKREFLNLYPELKGKPIADFWQERLEYESDQINWGNGMEVLFIVLAALLAGMIAKSPSILSISEAFFYPRNIGFIIFPVLSAYFVWKNKLASSTLTILAVSSLICLVFINSLPDNQESNTLILTCLHLPLILWFILGVSFVGGAQNKDIKRLNYLKYNGDLLVITALILISGAIMTGVTINLFLLIGYNIEKFYIDYVVVLGLPAAPIIGTHLTQSNPQLVNKISPVIAKLFSPLVLLMLVIYLAAMIYSAKNPYNDREFLLIFNILLIGVLALIFFSVAESSKTNKNRAEIWILFLLSVVTIIVNGIALSAIIYRITEYGITPNRAAVLGGNGLILINLLLVTGKLFRVLSKKEDLTGVGKAIARYLPIYLLWAVIVAFLFPFLFGFK